MRYRRCDPLQLLVLENNFSMPLKIERKYSAVSKATSITIAMYDCQHRDNAFSCAAERDTRK